jgi:hypothetical protein
MTDLTHATMNFPENKGKAKYLLQAVDDAQQRGVDVSLDTYPYLPGCTTLSALLPSWATEGGNDATLERLKDAHTREKIRVAVEEEGCDGGHGVPTDWATIQVCRLHQAKGAHIRSERARIYLYPTTHLVLSLPWRRRKGFHQSRYSSLCLRGKILPPIASCMSGMRRMCERSCSTRRTVGGLMLYCMGIHCILAHSARFPVSSVSPT